MGSESDGGATLVKSALIWLTILIVFASATECQSAVSPEPSVCVSSFVAPAYPVIARQARIEGTVRLRVQTNPEGQPVTVESIGGHPLLSEAAEQAVKQWRFCAGEAREREIQVVFKLKPEDASVFAPTEVEFSGAETVEVRAPSWPKNIDYLWLGTLPSPNEIRQVLTQGNETQKKALAKQLQLVWPAGTRRGDGEVPCLDYEPVAGEAPPIEMHNVSLQAPETQTVLLARPHGCWYRFIVVLEKDRGGGWRRLGTVPIFDKYEEAEISFQQLIKPGESEILVCNATTDAGTGMWQRNMLILKLFPDDMRVVFDQVQRQVFAIPIVRDGQPANTDQSQESEFWLVNPGPGEQGIKDILERQVVRDHKTMIVRWRIFNWDPGLEVFLGVGTDGNPGEGEAGTTKLCVSPSGH